MEPLNKNILLVSYVFPPYYGIGGRRWAKHAKGLTKLGYTVHVICADNPFEKESLWFSQIKNNSKIIIHTVQSHYPSILLKSNLSFFQKLKYKFWQSFLPLKTKGNPYDRALFWNESMLRMANELIQQFKIEKLICSGGPFSPMYHVTKLKNDFPALFILNDLRDPWTWAPNWGYGNLNEERMKVELHMEAEMVKLSDKVSVPTEGLLNELCKRYPTNKDKFMVIPHVFDEDEISITSKKSNNEVRLIYYGSIYEGIEPVFEQFFEFLKNNPSIKLDVYSDAIAKISSLQKYYSLSNVSLNLALNPKELFEKVNNSDYVLMINPDYNKDNISTKFYEIIYTKTPIVLISNDGLGPAFIKDNHLGWHLKHEKLEEELNEWLKNRNNFKYNAEYDLSFYALNSVCKIISAILEK